MALPADRDPVKAGTLVRAWPADAVTADLHTAGGFLFTAAVGGVEMFLSLADDVITSAVDGIRGAERDVAFGSVAIQRDVSDAFTTLDRVGASVGRELEAITYDAGEALGRDVNRFDAMVHTGLDQVGKDIHEAADTAEAAVAVVGQVTGFTQDLDDVGKWVRHNKGWLEETSKVLGWVSTGAAMLSVIPVVGEILMPVAVLALGAKTADDAALGLSGAESAGQAWSAIRGDAFDWAAFGVGEVASAGVKSAGTLFKAGKAAETATSDAAKADRSFANAQNAADAAVGTDAHAAAQAEADAAGRDAAMAHERADAQDAVLKQLREHRLGNFGGALKQQLSDDLLHPLRTSGDALRGLTSWGQQGMSLTGRAAGAGRYFAGAWHDGVSSGSVARIVFAGNETGQTAWAIHDAQAQATGG